MKEWGEFLRRETVLSVIEIISAEYVDLRGGTPCVLQRM
jgi:hypothetical protein